ncbi:hypothetical protein NADFUDRAFT_45270 [Nadsonia fulvescens var. elongata DSM 6958]|uniref:Uncharacterized protein n=1 Tax=Nadsonia fulvescens var. elongata DSM 6958 TaxID=857566 RepID=A0A1E3PQ41_9ASCO|nr:hypothetical protein NADFUDRAFT_45270 [Nadsonia fulvescens var. elongata DSM 6958]
MDKYVSSDKVSEPKGAKEFPKVFQESEALIELDIPKDSNGNPMPDSMYRKIPLLPHSHRPKFAGPGNFGFSNVKPSHGLAGPGTRPELRNDNANQK